MPTFDLSGEQIDQIAAFMQSLSTEAVNGQSDA
jgi:hypothetical protein